MIPIVSSKNNSEHVEVLVPPTEFEFVEVERTDSSLDLKESNNSAHEQKEEKQEEFEFPLFSFGVVEASTSPAQEEQGSSTQEKDTPQTEVSLMKISLKEPEEEIINQEKAQRLLLCKLFCRPKAAIPTELYRL
ncbi:YNL050C-like protein [Saccharomyces cerevisiae AWRI796]|nr:YNL050C-like protein [Saccharomyces cerevisiae AWRI796]